MSDGVFDASQPTLPRTTHEFRHDAEVRAQGHPYVRYRDGESFRAVALIAAASPLYIGRDEGCAVPIRHDERVSRRHARIIFGAGQWSIQDGPSRNGTQLDSKPTVGEQILADGSMISVGRTVLSFHAAPTVTVITTLAEGPTQKLLHPNATQRKVLVELARPFFMGRGGDIPVTPTNGAIAAALGYQVATIRDAVSDLYGQAELARGASRQREELVRLAIREGAVGPKDFT